MVLAWDDLEHLITLTVHQSDIHHIQIDIAVVSFEDFYRILHRKKINLSIGFGRIPGTSPSNYGNFYMGNTTIQMIPFMQRKLAKYALRQGLSGGFIPPLPEPSYIPMAAPMLAAATPLPTGLNPLIQNVYPILPINCSNWMTPSMFASALLTGPAPYRPPPSFQFPSNVGMVLAIPCGLPNPLLSIPSFGGFCPQYSLNGGITCCCSYCTPLVSLPPINCCPRPVSIPQPYPVPYPTPVPIPNIQQVPIPRPVSVVAPPIVAGNGLSSATPAGFPLRPSQGALAQSNIGQSLVTTSNHNSTTETLFREKISDNDDRDRSIPKTIDPARRAKAEKVAASLSNLGLNNAVPRDIAAKQDKYGVKSSNSFHHGFNDNISSYSVLNDNYNSTLHCLRSDRLPLLKKSKAKRHDRSSKHSNSHHHRNSFISDQNCLVCKQYVDKFS